MAEQKNKYQESMYFKEQHEYFLDLFSLEKDAFSFGGSNQHVLEGGTLQDFRLKTFGFLIALFFLKFLFDIKLPPWFEIIITGIICFLIVDIIIRIVNAFNESIKKRVFFTFCTYLLLLTAVIVVMGFVS